MKTEQISPRQLLFLLILLILATALLFLPAVAGKKAHEDAWITPIIATLGGLLLALIIHLLHRLYPNQTLFQWGESILGSALGKLMGVAYVVWLLHTNAIIIRESSAFITAVFLPRTPLLVISLLLIAAMVYALRMGIEVLARLGEMFVFTFLIVVFGLLLLVIPQMSVENLKPILANGWMPVLEGTITPLAWRGELILAAAFLPFLSRPKEIHKAVLWAAVITGVVLTVATAVIIMVYSAKVSSSLSFPFFSMARVITIAQFIERLDAFVMFAWVPALFIKSGVFLFAAALGVAQIFNLKKYQTAILPLAIVELFLSEILFHSDVEMTNFLGKYFPPVAFWFEYWIPILLLLIGFVRYKLSSQKSKEPVRETEYAP